MDINVLIEVLSKHRIDAKHIPIIQELDEVQNVCEFIYCIRSTDGTFEQKIHKCTENFNIKKNIGVIYHEETWRILLLEKTRKINGVNSYHLDNIYYDYVNSILQENDIELYKAIIEKYNCKKALECAVGTNRIGNQLYPYLDVFVGVDLSANMIKLATLKTRVANVSFYCDDMVNFDSLEKYDFIYCGYNSIQMLGSDTEVLRFLVNIRKFLTANGIVLIDLFNPQKEFLTEEKITEFKCSFTLPSQENHVMMLYETHQYDKKID